MWFNKNTHVMNMNMKCVNLKWEFERVYNTGTASKCIIPLDEDGTEEADTEAKAELEAE